MSSNPFANGLGCYHCRSVPCRCPARETYAPPPRDLPTVDDVLHIVLPLRTRDLGDPWGRDAPEITRIP